MIKFKQTTSDTVSRRISAVDIEVTEWLARYGITILRVGLGVVFLWFGLLKFIPGGSPAEELAGRTIAVLTFGLIQPSVSLVILAVWESVIGIGLITGVFLRATLLLLILQMLGTLTPLVFFPAETFTRIPYAPTLEGQYIIKNMVLIGAGLVIGATARGGHIVCEDDGHRRQTSTSHHGPLRGANIGRADVPLSPRPSAPLRRGAGRRTN